LSALLLGWALKIWPAFLKQNELLSKIVTNFIGILPGKTIAFLTALSVLKVELTREVTGVSFVPFGAIF
jgi:hypothetical protein